MSGHSRWSQIKHHKGLADQKRGQLFSKLARAVTLAARLGADPATNQTLQNAIIRARAFDLPKDNIERAIKHAGEKEAAALEALTVQAVGPGGVAVVVQAVTDNRNRAIAELKAILIRHAAKLVPPGSLNWQFDRQWNPTAPVTISDPIVKQKLERLFTELDDHAEVEAIYSNLGG